ncbi:MAG: undecaprenyl-diphosphate phosphatase [Deltaproteobacteria bacterium]|nr:undecaprenyl-diphosphate phosphatase [Deltaproteobacteria bacterium]
MDTWSIPIILGIVEGLTEFIPVSSTGHLIFSGALLGFTGDKASTFEVAIQLGAILSVVVLYWHRFAGLIPHEFNDNQGARSSLAGWPGIARVALTTVPALIVGYLAHDFVKTWLFTPLTVAWALAVGGAAIIIAERYSARLPHRSLDALTLSQAIGIGLFQTLSLWPGTSRSAATIIGGLLLGLDRRSAAEYSFLAAVPIMLAATGYEMLKMAEAFTPQDISQFIVGFTVSFLVAAMTVKTFIRFLSRWSLAPFAWYRIVAAPVFYLLTRVG